MSAIKRGKDFDKMIIESLQSNYSYFAWNTLGGIVERCEFKIKAFRRDYNEIELEPVKSSDADLAKVISGDRKLNFYIPELSLSFTSELKSVATDKKVKIYIPSDFSFYERRKHERLIPTKSIYISFEFNKSLFKKAIFDISLGGFAIILPKTDKMNIVKGKEFPLVILDLIGKKLKVKAECTGSVAIDRYKNENLPYGGFKIAFRIIDISKEDKEYLTEYVIHQLIIQKGIKKAT